MIGDHSISTSWFVSHLIFVRVDVLLLVINLQIVHTTSQPDLVLTFQDALLRVSHSQSLQDGPSGSSNPDASQQTLIEALPPILVLVLKQSRYDAAAGGVIKIGEPVQFFPELQIPFGTPFIFTPAATKTEDIS